MLGRCGGEEPLLEGPRGLQPSPVINPLMAMGRTDGWERCFVDVQEGGVGGWVELVQHRWVLL